MIRIILVGLSISIQLYAYPTLYPDYIDAYIQNSTNSNLIADDTSRNKFYVLPPSSSFAKVQGLSTFTANVGFCEEIVNLQKYSAEIINLQATMQLKGSETTSHLEDQRQKLLAANEDIAKYATINNISELINIDIKIDKLENRLSSMYLKHKMCTNECSVLYNEIIETQNLWVNLNKKRSELFSANYESTKEYAKKKLYVQALNTNIENLSFELNSIQTDLKNLYIDFSQIYDAHIKREGGRVSINYESMWTENLQNLIKNNPGYNFEKIKTRNVKIKANAYSKENLIPGGSILSFNVAGMNSNNILQLASFPDSFSGSAVLNLNAVCPMLHPDWFNLKSNNVEDLSFGITSNYEYQVLMKYGVTVKYNMQQMYEKIFSQGTRGSFLTSSHWSSEVENQFFTDSFDAIWDDKYQHLAQDKKMEIISDLRLQILNRIAGNLVMNNPSARLDLVFVVPNSGSIVISNSMRRSCSPNTYCASASVIFNVMQAVFGASNYEQNLKYITSANMVEKYSESQYTWQPITTTYK